MRATRVNHVSIHAADLEESARFYEGLFGLERLPTPTFPERVLWLRLGEQQLHLYRIDGNEPAPNQHFGIDVQDFDSVYERAKELGVLAEDAFGAAVRSHPMGWVQMYVRDPAGNLVEVDWPDASTLAPTTQAAIVPLETLAAQEGEAAVATLYT